MNGRTAKKFGVAPLLVAAVLPAMLSAQDVDPDEKPKDAPVTVRIFNGNWSDVRVYAVRNGEVRDRVGFVASFTTREFELPRWVATTDSQLHLIVVPIGSRKRYAAPPVLVSAGDVVEWRLANNWALSVISVRAG